MKLLLLKTLLQRRAKDEGFTLPMVIALGLVMLLLGAINLTSANEENINAITQNSRSDALAIAEIGVTQFRELLDRNRLLTLYDAPASGTNEWLGLTQICDGNIRSFAPGEVIPVTIAENGLDLNNDGDTTDSIPTGSYSLVSYYYNLNSGNFNQTDDAVNVVNVGGNSISATGKLTVKGETPDGNEAQIEVDIPIRINQQDMNNLKPALWIGDDTISNADLGNLTIGNGNIVLQDGAVTTPGSEADGCGDFPDDFANLTSSLSLPIISDPRSIPSIQPVIDTIAAAGTQINTTIDSRLGETNENPYVEPPVGETFNENTHCANIRDCRYYYKPTLAPSIISDVKADGIAAVTLYIDNPLTITASSNITIGSDVASNYFEIYVDNGNGITINTGSGNTVNIDAFIHAPQSTLTVTGTGTVNINGSVWVNDFINNTGARVNISPDTSNISSTLSSKAYEFYTTTTNRTPKPLTNSPTDWKTEEVTTP